MASAMPQKYKKAQVRLESAASGTNVRKIVTYFAVAPLGIVDDEE
jgi:hypothetical protein